MVVRVPTPSKTIPGTNVTPQDVTDSQNPATAVQIQSVSGTSPSPDGIPLVNDDLRIKLAPLHLDDIFNDVISAGPLGFLDPSRGGVGGILFPYTPTINFAQAVNYMDLTMVHSNTDYAAYTRTPSVGISITGKFTVQNRNEALYALACIHFLRTVSKSYFGESDGAQAGLPPPILTLTGYGNFLFNQLRVILKNHSWTFDDNVDSVVVATDTGVARLPTLFSISTELTVVQTPQRMRQEFSFQKFASGELMNNGNVGWV